ncbi:kinase-like domain-containing protein [Camillea tinctor]|nr:kinase-like domain-containing protein [Camillea tinctor]
MMTDEKSPVQEPSPSPLNHTMIEDNTAHNSPTSQESGHREENPNEYRPGGFHPVYIGDVFKDKYKVLNKIGYGRHSTVWLVRVLSPRSSDEPEFRALKILRSNYNNDGTSLMFEKDILTHLRDGNREHFGYPYVCHLLDDFEHHGPNGTHVCLVFELMGETLRSLGVWWPPHDRVPTLVMHRCIIQLLLALDFAHDHKVIHADIKAENIFVKFKDYSMIESGYLTEVPIPQQNRSEERYTVIPSAPLHLFYFKEAASFFELDIVLGDWGVSLWDTGNLCGEIQPEALRSPEVLIGAPWDAKIDFWNLGAIIFEIFQAIRMFNGRVPQNGRYELKEHLNEIVDFFGPFPKELLEKGNQEIVQDIFNDDGTIKDAIPINRPGLNSEEFLPSLKQKDRDVFVSFLEALMRINPAERAQANDLLRHPWIGALPPKPTADKSGT